MTQKSLQQEATQKSLCQEVTLESIQQEVSWEHVQQKVTWESTWWGVTWESIQQEATWESAWWGVTRESPSSREWPGSLSTRGWRVKTAGQEGRQVMGSGSGWGGEAGRLGTGQRGTGRVINS